MKGTLYLPIGVQKYVRGRQMFEVLKIEKDYEGAFFITVDGQERINQTITSGDSEPFKWRIWFHCQSST